MAKLSYLLALPKMSIDDMTRMMSISLRGELTTHTGMAFRHPNGFLPQHLSDLSALGYSISRGNLSEVNEVLKGDVGWLLNEADYSGNTPLVGCLSSPWLILMSVSISQPPGLASKSSRPYFSMVHRFIYVTRQAEHLCFLQRMPDSPNTSRCFEILEPIFMQMRWTLRN